MSSESKKKRGESGQAKAKNSPFRLNGRAPDWAARAMGCFHVRGAASSGSTTMRGMVGGALAEAMGHKMHGTAEFYEVMLAHAQPRCTHPLFT